MVYQFYWYFSSDTDKYRYSIFWYFCTSVDLTLILQTTGHPGNTSYRCYQLHTETTPFPFVLFSSWPFPKPFLGTPASKWTKPVVQTYHDVHQNEHWGGCCRTSSKVASNISEANAHILNVLQTAGYLLIANCGIVITCKCTRSSKTTK